MLQALRLTTVCLTFLIRFYQFRNQLVYCTAILLRKLVQFMKVRCRDLLVKNCHRSVVPVQHTSFIKDKFVWVLLGGFLLCLVPGGTEISCGGYLSECSQVGNHSIFQPLGSNWQLRKDFQHRFHKFCFGHPHPKACSPHVRK